MAPDPEQAAPGNPVLPPGPERSGFWTTLATKIHEGNSFLLIFGVIALVLFGGLGSTFWGMAQGNLWIVGAGLLLLVLCLLVAIWTVRSVLSLRAKPEVPAPSPSHPAPGTIPLLDEVLERNPTVRQQLLDISENVVGALRLGQPALSQLVVEGLADFQAEAGDWGSNQPVVSGARYNSLLIEMYASAEKSVFCTSTGEYKKTAWQTALGEEILRAHKRSKATVTRIFLFNSFSEVSAPILELMERQMAEGIQVMAFIDDEDEMVDLPPALTRDFTIIDDGRAIAITQDFSPGRPAARWHFADTTKSPQILKTRAQLQNGSVALKAIRERFDSAARVEG